MVPIRHVMASFLSLHLHLHPPAAAQEEEEKFISHGNNFPVFFLDAVGSLHQFIL